MQHCLKMKLPLFSEKEKTTLGCLEQIYIYLKTVTNVQDYGAFLLLKKISL